MKIEIHNLGSIRFAEFSLGKMTIICGKNNTGKTYATYALYGFLKTWREHLSIEIADEEIFKLLDDGYIKIDLRNYIKNAVDITNEACKKYEKNIHHIFSSSEDNFIDSKFRIKLEEKSKKHLTENNIATEGVIGSSTRAQLKIEKKHDSDYVEVSLLTSKINIRVPHDILRSSISSALKNIIFDIIFPNPFIASAERTGAAIFRRELDFARSRMLNKITQSKNDINPLDIILDSQKDYPLPVEDNVDFTRNLEKFSKEKSFIAKKHKDIIKDFSEIIGGEYTVTNDDKLFYIPKGKKIKLDMDESSSSVRSLLDIGFYINHLAKKGDILIVDEPELNLHPENQRKMARLFARLMNAGIKIFITTHSDYIIKELNTLIMLNNEKPYLKEIIKEEGYNESELISHTDVKVYIAKEEKIKLPWGKRKVLCQTLVESNVDKIYGIEVESFDNTIDNMNRVQESIVWGE